MGKRFILEASKQSRKPRRLARLLTAFMAITRITAGRNDRRKTSIQHSGRRRPSGRDDGREQGDGKRGRCRHAGRLLRAAARSPVLRDRLLFSTGQDESQTRAGGGK